MERTQLSIFGQSWMGAWFIFNVRTGEWNMCDNTMTSADHAATIEDLAIAIAKAEREGATVLAENAHLDEVVITSA